MAAPSRARRPSPIPSRPGRSGRAFAARPAVRCRANRAEGVHADREALPRALIPPNHEGHPDREGRAHRAHEEPDHQQRPVARHIAQQYGGDHRPDHHQREGQPATVTVSQPASRDSQNRPTQHRHRGQHQHLRIRPATGRLEVLRKRSHQPPTRKTDRKGDGRKSEIPRRPLHRKHGQLSKSISTNHRSPPKHPPSVRARLAREGFLRNRADPNKRTSTDHSLSRMWVSNHVPRWRDRAAIADPSGKYTYAWPAPGLNTIRTMITTRSRAET